MENTKTWPLPHKNDIVEYISPLGKISQGKVSLVYEKYPTCIDIGLNNGNHSDYVPFDPDRKQICTWHWPEKKEEPIPSNKETNYTVYGQIDKNDFVYLIGRNTLVKYQQTEEELKNLREILKNLINSLKLV